ncbi:methionine adenosyltransferase domain-containing protein, partial [Limosilactobacillus reuteri]
DETPEYMPLTLVLSHKLMRKIAQLRKDGVISYLRPDAKAEVTVEYDENDKPLRVDTVVLSTQHDPEVSLDQIKKDIKEQVRPAGIIEMLDLKRPIYKQTAAYGHFGRTDVDLPWEHLDKVDELKEILG